MYVYRTSKLNQKAQRFRLQEQVERLCVELERLGIDEAQAHFQRVYPYLKRRGENNLRLIARIRQVDDELVLCLLDIFLRGSKEYEHFLLKPEEYGKQYLDALLNEAELQRWLGHRQQSAAQTHQNRPRLPDDLLPWLEPPGWESEKDQKSWAIIYETEEWIARFKNPEIKDSWATYYRIISGIVESPKNVEAIAQWPGVYLWGTDNRYVLLSQLETADTPARQVLFLLAPLTHRPSTEEIAQIGQATNLFGAGKNILSQQLSLNKLTSFARCSYPSYLLAGDDQSWLAIESGAAANLALSSEEEAILNSVSTSAPEHKSLPLFLNGRAGSGKSTMLFYLFADYCYRKYYYESGKALPGNPLFLTYNKRLLEVAKEIVPQLLKSHYRFVVNRKEGEQIPDVSAFFQPFGTFLLSLLPKQERDHGSLRNMKSADVGRVKRKAQELAVLPKPNGHSRKANHFQEENYISFHRFKQLCRSAWPRYSPELCWQVIRTFIKGYYLDERHAYMDPDDYQEVSGKERTVSPAEFAQIYKTVWRWYRNLTEERGYWDDQDLIRRVLKLKCYRSEYTAIFCDEAQDFTRLELQLIMRLSVFSQYDLEKQFRLRLPFAFAGDPLQTLNPSGFRWSSLQSAFYNEVIGALAPTGRARLEMNFQELEYNYRSCPPIVKVNNLIQLWRQILFNIPEIKPQIAWKYGQFEPQKFILGRNIPIEELKFYLRQIIIIVPCDEGGELDYARNDPILCHLLSLENFSQPPWNLLSAIAAKGLEFKKIILYKFGEACNRGVWQITNDPPEEVKYFFNKLYVAASRATEHLFIVDSELGEQRLWQHATDEAELERFLARAVNPAQWRGRVQTISLGTSLDVLRDEDLHSIASEFEIQGLNSENPDFLRRAQGAYSHIGNTAKALLCEALALKFEGKFLDAGRSFLQLCEVDKAYSCFWSGMCWAELVTWHEQHPERVKAEYPIAVFMNQVESSNLDAVRNFTRFLKDCITNNQLECNLSSKQWKTALEEYAKRIVLLLSGTNLGLKEWQRFGDVLEALGLFGDNEMLNRAGACFWRAKNYESAVRCWENCNATRKRDYYLAKAEVLGFPACLEYLEKAGDHDRIIIEWEAAGKPLTTQVLISVGAALEIQQRYHSAFYVYLRVDNVVKVQECFERLSQGKQRGALEKLVQYLIRKEHWSELSEILEKYFSRESRIDSRKASLRFDIVYEVAYSKLKPEDIGQDYQRYEKFIKEQVLSSETWQNHLLMEQVGIALEKMGALVETLRFYEEFVSHTNPALQQFARERWIVTKRKQVDYFIAQSQSDKAAKSQSELQRNAAYWEISVDAVPFEPSNIPKHRPSPL